MKRALAAAALLLLSCEPAVRRAVTLTFSDAADLVTISATTTLGEAKPGTPDAAAVDDEREALLAGRDEWSLRFASAEPQSDRIVWQRRRGVLQSVEHIATIPSDNLQRFFYDTPLSINMIRGEGWAELTIVAGSSLRATRDEQQRVEKTIERTSERAASYFRAVRSMYLYLDEKPRRTTDMFMALFQDDKKGPPEVSDREQSLITRVRETLEALASTDEDSAGERDFDRVLNPFPADMKVVLPGEPLQIEGFVKQRDGSLLIKLPTALDAVAALEGRWISPDPLAAMLASEEKQPPEQLAASMAAVPRRAEAVVSASDIAAALQEKMRPAPRYRVRWVVKAGAPSPRPPHRPDSSAGGRTSAQSRAAGRTPAPRDSIAVPRVRSS